MKKIYDERRFVGILFVIGTIFVLFIVRLVDWQILNSDYYKIRAVVNNACIVKTDAIRGEILDSEGIGLAVNKTGYSLVFNKVFSHRGKENETIAKTTNFLERLGINWKNSLPIYISEEGELVFHPEKENQIKTLKKIIKASEEETVYECLEKLSKEIKCEKFSMNDKFRICGIFYDSWRRGEMNSKSGSVIIAENFNPKQMSILSECSLRLPGIKIQTIPKRDYSDSISASHVIGYIGMMSSEELEKYKGDYSIDGIIGKTGAEYAFDDKLRGYGGKAAIQLEKDGSILGSNEIITARPGNNVFLTISSKLQKCAFESLEKNIRNAKKKGAAKCESGAVVVLDVRDFSILAAVTYPSYNLSRYNSDKNYYSELVSDSSIPLFNRAFMGQYAPGSVFKPATACAALQKGVINPDEKINCGGVFNYYRKYKLHCMGKHGDSDLVRAMSKSCNVFFAELGRRIGGTDLAKFARKLGLGVKTGVELPESSGVLACPEYSESSGGVWYDSMASQAAIGQADTSVTPIQLAVYTAAIATGQRLKTHVLKKITDYEQTETIYENKNPTIIEKDIISEENLELVRRSIREVAISGTASDFKNFPIAIGAKTGTAQNKYDDHTTFACYAPFDKPEIAIAVVIANGKYGTNSKNVARDIMNSYFGF
ncbi:MAG: hypothetical protein LBK29_02655 [Oscillospiraceae bacterium]|jgi:penicillin-binding protein 2|nr:hypothetical protein [Oscillospiraceae bacterium]